MRIEFLGVPACGKSTLSRTLAQQLIGQGLIVSEPTFDLDHRLPKLARQWRKLCRSAAFLALHPHTAMQDMAAILQTRQATFGDLRKATLNWLFIRSIATAPRLPGEVTILDQGVAQAVWSIAFAAGGGRWWFALSEVNGRGGVLPDLVVRVRTDLVIVGDRLALRAHTTSRMNKLGRDTDALRRAEANCGVIAERLRALGIPVLEVQGNAAEDLDQGASRLAGRVLAARRNGEQLAGRRHGVKGMREPARERPNRFGLPRPAGSGGPASAGAAWTELTRKTSTGA